MKDIKMPLLLLLAVLVRVLVVGAGLGDALVLTSLTGLYAFFLHMELKKEVPVNKSIIDRIVYLEEQLQASKDKINALQIGGHFLAKRN